MAKHVTEMKPDYTQAMDIRGKATDRKSVV